MITNDRSSISAFDIRLFMRLISSISLSKVLVSEDELYRHSQETRLVPTGWFSPLAVFFPLFEMGYSRCL